MIDWDDGSPMNWIGPYPSGENATVSHTFTSAATYYIKAKANDSDGDESQWSEPYIITIVENDPPSDPIIDGETSGKTGVEYTYTFQSTDPNGDALYYYVDWGDGTPIVEWDGPHQSGDLASISHTFETQGIFIITAKAKDIYDEESGFSQLQVNMPRNKAIVKTNIFKFLHRFTEILNLIQSLRIK
jgi:PKD repeat protein